jgi:tetratricopeptide (TPR) repeat protein
MNTELLNALKQIIAKQGDSILSDHRRVSGFLADMASDVPKPQKNARVKCLEYGYAQTLKDTPEKDRAAIKQQLAKKLHEEEGLDLGVCGQGIDVLAAALFGEEAPKVLCQNCKKELQEEWKSCPFCGTAVRGGKKTKTKKDNSSESEQTFPAAAKKTRQKQPKVKESEQYSPQDAQAFLNSGMAHFMKDNDRALADYTQAIRLNPNLADAYGGRAIVYQMKGNHDQCIADCTQSIRLSQNRADVSPSVSAGMYHIRGDSYFAKSYFDQAIDDYNQALRLDPNNALTYANRGRAYSWKGDINQAFADCNQAIQMNPNFANAYAFRGIVYVQIGNFEQGMADLNTAMRIEPNNAVASQFLASVYQQGQAQQNSW